MEKQHADAHPPMMKPPETNPQTKQQEAPTRIPDPANVPPMNAHAAVTATQTTQDQHPSPLTPTDADEKDSSYDTHACKKPPPVTLTKADSPHTTSRKEILHQTGQPSDSTPTTSSNPPCTSLIPKHQPARQHTTKKTPVNTIEIPHDASHAPREPLATRKKTIRTNRANTSRL
ncbi:MAG: hypothetical protein J5965_16730 [Aeriscardovia sp.]|nr:hypothetical protein [Aeriscardovia sp.]